MAQISQQRAIRIHGENVGRSLRKRFVAASEPSWDETGRQFHLQMRPRRFTEAHAVETGYEKRSPKYTKSKFRKFGHRNPLQFSGEVRRLTQTAHYKVRKGTGQTGNQGGVQIIYRGARKLNRNNPNSPINMADEFRRITNRESLTLGVAWQFRFSTRFTRG